MVITPFDLADEVVPVGDVQIADSVHRDASGLDLLGGRSGDGVDDPTRDHANSRIIREVYMVCGINGDANGIVQLSCGCGAAVAAEARSAVSGDSGNHSVSDFANAVVSPIRDVQAAG